MKNKVILFLALSIAAAVLTQPLSAGVIPANDIQITETSSTSLSATFNGSAVTVQNTAPDRWTLTFSDTFTFGAFVLDLWAEPEDNTMTKANSVEGTETNQLFIRSDILSGHNTVPDGTQFVENLSISGIHTTVGITFHDSGDGAKIPDSGSTSGLLFLSLIALVAVSRRRSALV
jgi:hypothetical protein